ncbi:SOS response-associated peptidase [Pseudomonas sp. PDM18]|uniref:SOS response-associated peptidase n=1 Tax=Pseudomonas sp. PDM18 TaxID=2769253 RepID=UPI00177F71AA|nr:SOS response-associated peptidase [Pseudomonas sp. PDM18]MBD9680762.1 SOS response-associated peptidase [Pseudomonas sp. PDM18]
MCGRYVSPEEAAIERYWHIGARTPPRGLEACYNVAPTMTVPILRHDERGQLELLPARWGLIPSWWKESTLPRFSFNARSEEAAGKPLWRQALRSTRCLMPALGWYEWNEKETLRNPAGRQVHQPYFIHSPTAPIIAIAGLWSLWTNPNGEPVLSCALLTKSAALSIEVIHHRMPVVLAPENFEEWLSAPTCSEALGDLVLYSREDFVGNRVSLGVNDVRNDSVELIAAVTRLH